MLIVPPTQEGLNSTIAATGTIKKPSKRRLDYQAPFVEQIIDLQAGDLFSGRAQERQHHRRMKSPSVFGADNLRIELQGID